MTTSMLGPAMTQLVETDAEKTLRKFTNAPNASAPTTHPRIAQRLPAVLLHSLQRHTTDCQHLGRAAKVAKAKVVRASTKVVRAGTTDEKRQMHGRRKVRLLQ